MTDQPTDDTYTLAFERRVRRHLARNGLRLVKVRENSPDYPQYGPYYIVDVSINGIVASGVDDLGEWLND